MNVTKVIRTRRAIRKFSNKPITDNILKIILEAGRLAPSSKNGQPCRFIVIRNKDTLKQISQCTYSGDFLASAKVGVAIFTQDAKLPEIDAARAIQNMILQAWEYQIGSCWITNYWGDKVKQILNIPSSGQFKLITVIPFGYLHPDVVKPKGTRIRLSFNEVVFDEEFGKSMVL